MSRSGNVPRPPQAPKIDRKLVLDPLQAIGVPLLALIPILALAGLFGIDVEQRSGDSGVLSVNVEYPARTRLQTSGTLTIEVGNSGEQSLTGVTVGVERDYVEAFSEVSFTPSAAGISDDQYVVDLGEVPAGAWRRVVLEFSPQRYWRQRGTVNVSVEGGDSASVDVSTFVYP
jgi:hypothetical protein